MSKSLFDRRIGHTLTDVLLCNEKDVLPVAKQYFHCFSQRITRMINVRRFSSAPIEFHDFYLARVKLINLFAPQIKSPEVKTGDLLANLIEGVVKVTVDEMRSIQKLRS